MTKNLCLIFLLTFLSFYGYSQNTVYYENEVYISWSPSFSLDCNDYNGEITQAHKKQHEKNKLYTNTTIGIMSFLDVPKKKRQSGKLIEKVYFAPVFNKNESGIINCDSVDFDQQKIYLDIAELFSRIARSRLKSYQDSIPGYGILWMMYSTVKNCCCSEFHSMLASYDYDVYVEKKEGAHDSWKKSVDKLLEVYKDFATTPKDIERIFTGKPVDEGYELSKKIMGALNDCGG